MKRMTYVCGICGKEFKKEKGRNVHVALAHRGHNGQPKERKDEIEVFQEILTAFDSLSSAGQVWMRERLADY